MLRYAPEKTVPVPPFGRIDISDYLPVINSEAFQRLKHKTQLSLVKEVFPGATHTRYLHSLGVMDTTRKIVRSMFSRGFFPGEDHHQLERELCIAALVHDIGHPAYSHMVEYVLASLTPTPTDHNKVGEEIIIGEAASAITQSGADPARIRDLLDKKHPSLGRIITAKSIGADKLAYLVQDHHMTGYDAARPPAIDSLLWYITPLEGEDIGAEEKAEDLLISLQEFYFTMYTNVYLRKQCLAVGRMLQKALEFHLQETGTDPLTVWHQREGWIDTRLEESPASTARELYQRIATRNILHTAVTFKPENYRKAERVAGKNIAILPLSIDERERFLHQYTNPRQLTSLEGLLAEKLQLSPSELVVTVVPDPRKLVPEDIQLVDSHGRPRGTLFERLPQFHQVLREKAEAFFSIRVMVPERHRSYVSSRPLPVEEIIKGTSVHTYL